MRSAYRKTLVASARTRLTPWRWLWLVGALVGCASGMEATAPSPAPQVTPQPAATEPAPDPAVAVAEPPPPAAEPKPRRDLEPEESFEPIELTDQQRTRARAIQRHVRQAAQRFDIEPNLLNAIIWAESKFNPKARNRSGARGLMQLMPGTSKAMAKKLGRPNRPYDPAFAVQAGAQLLAILKTKFDGDRELMLFGYARGTGSVRKWQREGGDIPEGVQKFIARVTRAQRTFDGLGWPEATAELTPAARR
jgi:soluble lytic murein transglycosylase-like protein